MAKRKWTDDQLRSAVEGSITFKGTMENLGLKPGGGSENYVRARIKELDLSTDHFRRGGYGTYKSEDARVFSDGVPFNTNHRRRFLKLVPYKCSWCGLSEWNGKELILQLDHVDGNRWNNTLENLRMLCPNCHSQTETWSKKKA